MAVQSFISHSAQFWAFPLSTRPLKCLVHVIQLTENCTRVHLNQAQVWIGIRISTQPPTHNWQLSVLLLCYFFKDIFLATYLLPIFSVMIFFWTFNSVSFFMPQNLHMVLTIVKYCSGLYININHYIYQECKGIILKISKLFWQVRMATVSDLSI